MVDIKPKCSFTKSQFHVRTNQALNIYLSLALARAEIACQVAAPATRLPGQRSTFASVSRRLTVAASAQAPIRSGVLN